MRRALLAAAAVLALVSDTPAHAADQTLSEFLAAFAAKGRLPVATSQSPVAAEPVATRTMTCADFTAELINRTQGSDVWEIMAGRVLEVTATRQTGTTQRGAIKCEIDVYSTLGGDKMLYGDIRTIRGTQYWGVELLDPAQRALMPIGAPRAQGEFH